MIVEWIRFVAIFDREDVGYFPGRRKYTKGIEKLKQSVTYSFQLITTGREDFAI